MKRPRIVRVRRRVIVPLTKKGEKVLASMKKQYGVKKGKEVFYSSINSGKLKGVHKKK